MTPQALTQKQDKIARLEYLVEDGHTRYETELLFARNQPDSFWEDLANPPLIQNKTFKA